MQHATDYSFHEKHGDSQMLSDNLTYILVIPYTFVSVFHQEKRISLPDKGRKNSPRALSDHFALEAAKATASPRSLCPRLEARRN